MPLLSITVHLSAIDNLSTWGPNKLLLYNLVFIKLMFDGFVDLFEDNVTLCNLFSFNYISGRARAGGHHVSNHLAPTVITV